MTSSNSKPDAIYYVTGVIIVLFLVIMFCKFVLFKERATDGGSTVSHYVMHYADWCPACRGMKPIWEKVVSQLPKPIYRMNNIDNNPVDGVTTIPTIIRHYKDGTEERYAGGRSEDRLKAFLSVT